MGLEIQKWQCRQYAGSGFAMLMSMPADGQKRFLNEGFCWKPGFQIELQVFT
jgi:hypothetical protein